jgi:hypothetical protein
MQSRKAKEQSYTVRKVTDNHWGLVYMGCPARSANGKVHRFQTEKEAQDAAQHLNECERKRSAFLSGPTVSARG